MGSCVWVICRHYAFINKGHKYQQIEASKGVLELAPCG